MTNRSCPLLLSFFISILRAEHYTRPPFLGTDPSIHAVTSLGVRLESFKSPATICWSIVVHGRVVLPSFVARELCRGIYIVHTLVSLIFSSSRRIMAKLVNMSPDLATFETGTSYLTILITVLVWVCSCMVYRLSQLLCRSLEAG